MATKYCHQGVLADITCGLGVKKFLSQSWKKKVFFVQTKLHLCIYYLLGAANDSHLPPLGDEEAALSLHRGVWRVRELQVVLTDLTIPSQSEDLSIFVR